MDLKTFTRPLIKWWWLILVATLIAAISSYIVTSRQPPVYQSRTTLVVGSSVYESNPSGGDFYLNQQLSSFYANIAQREVVRNATMEALGISWLPAYTVRPIPNSQLMEIVVTDTNPARAQAVANELAAQLIRQTPTGNSEEQEHQAFIEEQLSQLEEKILETQAEITRKQEELADLFSARQIAEAQTAIAALEAKLSDLQTNYATLLSNSNRGAANTLSLIETANLPSSPVGPDTRMVVFLSAAIAFVIASGAAYLLEYLDDTLKSPEEISRLLDLPIVGYIPKIDNYETGQGVYVAKHPRSVVAEAFRSLRTDLEFSSVDASLRSIYVTSADTDAGKTTLAANLAAIISQGGKEVILLDADLRKPNVHRNLGIPNNQGLSDVFRGNLEIDDVISQWQEDNFAVITSGEVPPNPAELLSSKKMDQTLNGLLEKVDIVVIDGPPFVVTDATIISAKVDGVLLIVRYGRTHKNAAVAAVKQLRRSESRIVGVVINGVPRNGEEDYGIYSYYHKYYGDEEVTRSPNGKLGFMDIFKRMRKTPAESGETNDVET